MFSSPAMRITTGNIVVTQVTHLYSKKYSFLTIK